MLYVFIYIITVAHIFFKLYYLLEY